MFEGIFAWGKKKDLAFTKKAGQSYYLAFSDRKDRFGNLIKSGFSLDFLTSIFELYLHSLITMRRWGKMGGGGGGGGGERERKRSGFYMNYDAFLFKRAVLYLLSVGINFLNLAASGVLNKTTSLNT